MREQNTDRARFALLGAGALLALVATAYWRVLDAWVGNLWEDPDRSHGLLVPFVSAWLVYERRERLSAATKAPAVSGLFIVLAAVIMFIAGLLSTEYSLTRLSLIVIIAGLIVLNLGYRRLRLLAFPVAFLLFAVPVPVVVFNSIAFPLQLLASKLAVSTLHAFDLPALREGNVIVLPNGTLEVAEACSGLRSLMALAATSVLMAGIALRGAGVRLLLVAAAIPVAVALNGARVSGTGILAYRWGTGVAEGFFHGFSSWALFVAAIAALAAITALLRRFDGEDA